MCNQENLYSVYVVMASLRLTELDIPDDLLQVPGDKAAPRFLLKQHIYCVYGYPVYHKAFVTSADAWSC